jgi:hypothetical protein
LEARAAVKQFQWQKHLRLAADAARSRKLNRLAASFIGRRGGSGVESLPLWRQRHLFKRLVKSSSGF